jgi:hypothetical protein
MKAASSPSSDGILASLAGGSMTTVSGSTTLPAEESESEPLAEQGATTAAFLPFATLAFLGAGGS